ncbi:MAG TPA: hypothetical protein PK018_06775 [Candidatus Competibacter sp.]|nr:hypothetical protein [Candidatus Competibacteraceae bacterium]HPE71860.1 hypothetical protein [Candidatus Competibacter sp.]HRX71108.1 hypothetical protein [Candidatus Competibacteraceae bacterium]
MLVGTVTAESVSSNVPNRKEPKILALDRQTLAERGAIPIRGEGYLMEVSCR